MMKPIKIRALGVTDYNETFVAMRKFTETRTSETPDEIWLTEHRAVFTQGRAGKPEHVLNPQHIPIVQSDRGGQVTYHGLGQAVIYPLVDIRRAGIGVRDFVTILEKSVISVLKNANIDAYADPTAPGVYVDVNAQRHKIASLGLRVRKGATYHGIALNVKMDLLPFTLINPCGFVGLPVTQTHDLDVDLNVENLQKLITTELINKIN